MALIPQLLLENIKSITEKYALNVAEPTRLLGDIRGKLIEEGALIRPFETKDISNKSLVAIDGGRITQQLAGGDLIIVGATVGEGHSTVQNYTTDDMVPSEVYGEILPHVSSNSELGGVIMSVLELRVFAKANADIKIIDGAYLGNVSTLLYALTNGNLHVINAVLALNNYDEDGLLRKAVNDILNPSHDAKNIIAAVPKSDSSEVYAHHILGAKNPLAGKITDRLLAARILCPGEMFEPRPLQTNNAVLSRLEKLEESNFSAEWIRESDNPALLKELLKGKAKMLRNLVDKEDKNNTLIWTTYFKPSSWSEHAPVVKVEFFVYPENIKVSVEDYAKYVVGAVDSDIIDEYTLEPWSQYMADVRAKEVSQAADIIKNHLVASAETSFEVNGLIRNYRT